MNQNVRNEVSFLLGSVALILLLTRKKKFALYAAATALMLRFLPLGKYSFRGRSVVIAGGSRGLGLALAENLVREKAEVTLLARDPDELCRAEAHLREIDSTARISIHPCDLTDKDELASALAPFRTGTRRIDVYIHDAGLISVGPFESQTKFDLQKSMNLHVFAPFEAIEMLTPVFKAQGGGRIVNISSIGGKIAVPHLLSYCVSKFALTALSKGADIELGPYGIRVTTVYPGLMRTGSPIHALFKGDQEKEFAWFASADSTPLLTVSAQTAAKQILRGVAQGKSEIIVSVPAKLGIYAHAIFPALVDSVLSLVNRVLPKDSSKAHLPGILSSAWLDRQIWSYPLKFIRNRAERRYNQEVLDTVTLSP